jgi:hypothetical protein
VSDTRCADCGSDTLSPEPGELAEYYAVHDSLWAEAGMAPDGGYLCIGCLEARLGRRLYRADFPDQVPINHPGAERGRYAWSWRTPRLAALLAYPDQGVLFDEPPGPPFGRDPAGFEAWMRHEQEFWRQRWREHRALQQRRYRARRKRRNELRGA